MKQNGKLGESSWLWVLALTLVILIPTVGQAAQPNLLIIQTDEHHFATLGCYGGTIVETPHIDWLAENGAICTSFYATTPVCSPSRASLVSGKYPQNTPVVSNNIPLADGIVTFAEVLRARGYATGYAGKWHLDGGGKPQWAPKRQFGFADNRFMFNRGHWKQFADTGKGPIVSARNNKGAPTYAVEGADAKSFSTDWLTGKAIEFIEQHQEQPFCYMLSLPDPHGPNTVRPPYDTMYAGVRVPIPRSLRKQRDQIPKWAVPDKSLTANRLTKLMPAYYGMVKCIDDNVGRLLGTLRKRDLLANTIIVFTSDHGDLCGEHGRLNKGVPYEGSARIPFVIYHHAGIRPGTVVPEALGCVDFAPTVLPLLGATAPEGVEGRDFSGLLSRDASQRPDWNDVAFVRGTGNSGWISAISDRYKLVLSRQDDPWLFDLEQDPDELHNQFNVARYRPTVRRLAKALSEYCRQHNDPFGSIPTIQAQLRQAAQ